MEIIMYNKQVRRLSAAIFRRRIEVAITSLTRNQVVGQPARGFESHRLRYFLHLMNGAA